MHPYVVWRWTCEMTPTRTPPGPCGVFCPLLQIAKHLGERIEGRPALEGQRVGGGVRETTPGGGGARAAEKGRNRSLESSGDAK